MDPRVAREKCLFDALNAEEEEEEEEASLEAARQAHLGWSKEAAKRLSYRWAHETSSVAAAAPAAAAAGVVAAAAAAVVAAAAAETAAAAALRIAFGGL